MYGVWILTILPDLTVSSSFCRTQEFLCKVTSCSQSQFGCITLNSWAHRPFTTPCCVVHYSYCFKTSLKGISSSSFYFFYINSEEWQEIRGNIRGHTRSAPSWNQTQAPAVTPQPTWYTPKPLNPCVTVYLVLSWFVIHRHIQSNSAMF